VKKHRIAVLPGDGIGPEVTAEAVQTLLAVEGSFRLEMQEFSVGAGEYLKSGDPMPPETFEAVKGFDAILLGAMGLPQVRWPNGTEMAPQLDLREKLELYAGVRPVRLYHENDTPLKGGQAGSIDFVVFRENTEGMFWSRKGSLRSDEEEVVDGLRISRRGSERLFRAAFREAQKRRGLVTLVDKSNVLPSLAFFRRIFDEVGEEFPDVKRERIYVDAAALYLVQRPEAFDVIVTENLFGDILSDLAAGLVGGMGMAPSGDIGDRWAVFQPSHGSAPDIAGRGWANPTATILSAAMMLEWLGEAEAAARIRGAVERVFADPGLRTRDLGGKLGTAELGAKIREGL
jgi:3-isopropylmalate dehydrogenase